MKRFSAIILSLTIILTLAGCKSNTPVVEEDHTVTGQYILTTSDGRVSMFDEVGNVISEVTLSGSPESEYIYTIDNGNIYVASLQQFNSIPKLLYAVDKATRRLTFLTITSNQIMKRGEVILSDSNITQIYGYNGLFYYSVSTQDIEANPYSFERRQKLNENGTLSYIQTVPIENTSESTFIYMENYFDKYLEYTGISQHVSSSDKTTLNIPDVKHQVFEIPTTVSTWTANNNNIYFFSETQMGTYNVINNKITVYYGTINPILAQYQDGINKENYLLSDFGDQSSKTVILKIDYDNMKVDQVVQIDYNNAMDMIVDKGNYIMMVFKVSQSDKTFAQLRVLNYDDCSELYITGVEYLPTKVLADEETVYLFNPYEDYFLTGSIHSGNLREISKDTEMGNIYSDIFLVDLDYKSDYYYDESGRYVNRDGHLINENGELIDENNDRVNMLGQRIDTLGRAINKNGQLIDRYNNIIDIDGNITQYIMNADGYYYNSEGKKVDIDGTVLVRNKDGDWVRPEDSGENEIVITGHYDEFGNFIIDKKVLELYPDAYEIWQNNGAGK